MSTKTTFLRGFGVVAMIGLMSLVLGASLAPAAHVQAADVLMVSVAITASPSTICAGQSAHITWSSTDATSISINQGIGSVLPYGDRLVSPTQTTTYIITGTNGTGGYGTASATVFISGPCSNPTPTPTHTHTPTPTPTPTSTPFVYCAPAAQTIDQNTTAQFSASGGSGIYLWSAPTALPDGWYGHVFEPIFTVPGTHTVSVTSPGASNTATCAVYVRAVTPTPTPTWTPWPTPTPNLSCMPSYQETSYGQYAQLSASGGTGSYYWSAPYADPTYGYNSTFSTRFWSTSPYGELRAVTVHSGSQSAECFVRVFGGYTPTPTPTPGLYCTPSYQTVAPGQYATVTAYGGNGTYSWSAPYADPTYGYAQTFSTRYWDTSQYGTTRTITVQSGSQSAGCTVQISGTATPTPTPTWTPTPGQYLAVTKYGRNITRGQTVETDHLYTSYNQTLEFIIRVRSLVSWTLYGATVQDVLPAGIAYIPNTTSVNNQVVADGISGSGINLGVLTPNQEVLVKFSGIVTATGSFPSGSTAYNTVYAHASTVSAVTAQLPITMGEVLGVSTVKTGPAGNILIALLASGLVTFGYMRYTGTALFRKRDALAATRRSTSNRARLNFARFL